MADQFENQLPQKSDAKWVRAVDASGNPILISKEDLASVVGGLIGVNESWNRNRGLVSDFDNATLAGVYKISNYGGNNNPNIDYGVLCVYSIEGYIMQTAYSVWGNKVAYRARTEKELWSDWMSL